LPTKQCQWLVHVDGYHAFVAYIIYRVKMTRNYVRVSVLHGLENRI